MDRGKLENMLSYRGRFADGRDSQRGKKGLEQWKSGHRREDSILLLLVNIASGCKFCFTPGCNSLACNRLNKR